MKSFYTYLFHLIQITSALINFRGGNLPREYPFHTIEMAPYHPKIHGYSNIGFLGDIHAKGVPIATKIIDILAYNNRNVRQEIADELFKRVNQKSNVIDLGSSTGMMTTCLWNAGFKNLSALDASPQMLKYAKMRLPKEVDLVLGNAGLQVPSGDSYVCSFVMHELPSVARKAILKNVYDNMSENGMLLVIDIHQTYTPKEVMLQGEPFCLDYIQNFNDEIKNTDFKVESKTWIENHVQTWWCTKGDLDSPSVRES